MKDINPIKLAEFRNEMMEILKEKFDKYQNIWKNSETEYLLFKLKQQLKQIRLYTVNSEITKRKLLHIANYCYFIYEKLKEV